MRLDPCAAVQVFYSKQVPTSIKSRHQDVFEEVNCYSLARILILEQYFPISHFLHRQRVIYLEVIGQVAYYHKYVIPRT